MKRTLPLRFASALLLSLVTGSTLAATARVETEVNTLFDPNGVTRMLGCGNHDDCRRSSVNNAPLLPTDPDGVSASSNLHYDFFTATNTSSVPTFLFTGTGQAQARLGSLHASAEVELTGLGGVAIPQGVSAVAVVSVEDIIRVQSSTLPAGTVVTLNVLMNVSGRGRASASVTVQNNLNPGPLGSFHDTNSVSSDLASVDSISGQFTAEVGSLLSIRYALRASTGVSVFGWEEDEIANGRVASSIYGNSAYLYFSAADPVNVSLQGLSGHDYVQPNPVPLPAAIWLMMPGIVVLARCRRLAVGSINTLS